MINVFVYGTLKPGESNYYLCANYVVDSQPAIAFGQLYALPLGYPAMTPGVHPIQGFVLSFVDPTILNILDEYEQHDPQTFKHYFPDLLAEEQGYDRTSVEVYDQAKQSLGLAWSYVMTVKQVQRLGGVLLPAGYWCSQQLTC